MDRIDAAELEAVRRRAACLIRLYPRTHRERHGYALQTAILDYYCSLSAPMRGSNRFWVGQVADLLSSAVQLHVYFLLRMEGMHGAAVARRIGIGIGLLCGISFGAGALVYNLTDIFSGLSEGAGDLICLALLMTTGVASGRCAGSRSGCLRHGALAGMLTSGILSALTGCAYLLLDTLFFGVTSHRWEWRAAFAHSGSSDMRLFLLMCGLKALAITTTFGLITGLILGMAGAASALMVQRSGTRAGDLLATRLR